MPLVAAILWLMERAGQLWWLWAWLLWMTFSLFVTWGLPDLDRTLFNRFKSLMMRAARASRAGCCKCCGFTSKGYT